MKLRYVWELARRWGRGGGRCAQGDLFSIWSNVIDSRAMQCEVLCCRQSFSETYLETLPFFK